MRTGPELLEQLGREERSVEELALRPELTFANASRHARRDDAQWQARHLLPRREAGMIRLLGGLAVVGRAQRGRRSSG
jgi:hypothetical protein